MLAELLTLRTEDGCFLDGAYWQATAEPPARADALMLVHGATSNAFAAIYRRLAEGLAQAGVSVLSLNTRGHDVLNVTAGAERRIQAGTAAEDLDEAPFDLKAGMRWLQDRGHRRVGLAGHSLGAVKAVFTQAEGQAGAACVIALSPPRFHHASILAAHGDRFRKTLAEARAGVEAGKPEALLRTAVPIPTYFGAAQYLKKYGPEDRYDVVALLPRTGCPTLLLWGSKETGPGSAVGNSAAAAPRLVTECPQIATVEIEGADHVYTGTLDRVLDSLRGWLGAEA